jgi:hypothetical protein
LSLEIGNLVLDAEQVEPERYLDVGEVLDLLPRRESEPTSEQVSSIDERQWHTSTAVRIFEVHTDLPHLFVGQPDAYRLVLAERLRPVIDELGDV